MIDKSISFLPVNISVLTISDSRTVNDDKSGKLLKDRIIKSIILNTDRRIKQRKRKARKGNTERRLKQENYGIKY